MTKSNILKDSFQKTAYKLSQHGPRNAGVLQAAFESVDADLESDIYGTGPVIEKFQEKIAAFLGKETAVFFPSGTMAQQAALRIWADEKGNNKIAYHPLSHLEIHEQDALKELQSMEPLLLGTADRLPTLDDIRNLSETVSCILLELPQREIGGQLPSFAELEEISIYCRSNGIRLHLDGARLWEITPYYQKSEKEICALFDSVYVSFYKGLGGIAGAILAGDADFTEVAKIWKRRYGGDLISLYPYIVSADFYFDKRIGKMEQYHEAAKDLACRFNACDGVKTVPEVPVSNMFHVHFEKPAEAVEPILAKIHAETNIGCTSYLHPKPGNACGFELSVGDAIAEIPAELLEQVFEKLGK
ncbi:aminotransferase class I/II-fold pyridoxal phosphate-dependent enzyme [Listeria rocourtiae]|uniref:threonine aldolase family protein n=1 Tax=Listeria rocourtiae TaxID=647910 RepID=UPI003D2F5A99